MKKLVLIAICVLFTTFSVSAVSDRPIKVSELPADAQAFLEKYFSGIAVSYATYDDDVLKASYDVVLTNGISIEFNKNGEWTDVDGKYIEIPKGIVNDDIQKYVSANFNAAKIVQIEKDKNQIEVTLDNKLELIFGSNNKFIRMED